MPELTPDQAIETLKGLPEDRQRKILAKLSPEVKQGIIAKLSATSASAATQDKTPASFPGFLDPHPGENPMAAFFRGGAAGLVNPVLHPIQTIESMGQALQSANLSAGGGYQGTAPTMFSKTGREAAAQNDAARQEALAGQAEAGKQAASNPSYTAGSVIIPGVILEGAGRGFKGLKTKTLEGTRTKYGPREVKVGSESIPVMVGEASPESGPGRLQASLKRSGASSERFENVEGKQQDAVKNVIRDTAQKTSGAIGPMQLEPSDVVNDAATASYVQAAPLYDKLDASLVKVPDALKNVSRITQDAINKAQKLGVNVGEGVDLTKITPEKDGTVQWGGSKISKTTHPERWDQLVKEGIIDDSGGATPLKAYRQVRSQLIKMQRASADPGIRYAIGKDIETMTDNINSALKGTEVEKSWEEANRLWSKGKALQDVSEAVRDATKGTPASAQAPGVTPVSTKLQGASLVSKLNDLYHDGKLEKAFSHEEISNLRQAADILDRIQRTPVGKGSGESMSMARGLTHAIRGNTGPLVGAGIGAAVGGLTGAEFGAGIGFVLQKIGEQGLVRVMTKVDGVNALRALADAKTPAESHVAIKTIVALGAGSGFKGAKTRKLEKSRDQQRGTSEQP